MKFIPGLSFLQMHTALLLSFFSTQCTRNTLQFILLFVIKIQKSQERFKEKYQIYKGIQNDKNPDEHMNKQIHLFRFGAQLLSVLDELTPENLSQEVFSALHFPCIVPLLLISNSGFTKKKKSSVTALSFILFFKIVHSSEYTNPKICEVCMPVLSGCKIESTQPKHFQKVLLFLQCVVPVDLYPLVSLENAVLK